MPRIFMSYRRADSVSESGRIHDHLDREFGGQNVFKDVDDIPPGHDFRKVLDDEVSKCDVLLAIIGPDWVTTTDADGNYRLHNPDDFVRIEVESGLKRGEDVLVIPLLVKNAPMPSADDLPDSLKDLVYHNAVIIRDDPDFNRDMRRLIDYVRRYTYDKSPPRLTPNRLMPIAGVILAVIVIILLGIALINGGNPPPTETSTNATATLAPSDAPLAGNRELAGELYDSAQAEAGNANYDKAIELYTKAIETDETYASAYVGRALAYGSGFGDFDTVIPDLEQAVALDPQYGEAFRYLGQYQYFQNDYDIAETNLSRAIELDANDSDARAMLAQLLIDIGRYQEALDQFNVILDDTESLIPEKHYDAVMGQGYTYSALGMEESAIESFLSALELDENRPEAYASLGNIYVYLGDVEQAIAYLTSAIDKTPDDADNYYNRGTAHLRLFNLTEARNDFDSALQLDPNRVDAYVGRGQVYMELEDYVTAITQFNQALSRDDTHAEAYFERGLAHYKNQSYEQAVDDFSSAINLNGHQAEAYAYRGLSQKNRFDFDEMAEADLETALEFGLPAELEYTVLNELGWLKLDRGDETEALNLFTRAIVNNPDILTAYEGQADVFIQQAYNADSDSDAYNNWLSALDSLNRGLDTAGDDAQVYLRRGEIRAELGWLAADQVRYEQAIQDYEQAIALDETLALAYSYLADMMLSLEDYAIEDALLNAEIAYGYEPDNPIVLSILAAVYEENDDIAEAIRFYQLALDNSVDDDDMDYYQSELDRLTFAEND